jgi:hypothetical protein
MPPANSTTPILVANTTRVAALNADAQDVRYSLAAEVLP